MMQMKEQMLEMYGYADDGWTVDYAGVLICPHGRRCEDDGGPLQECGCVSPMRRMGII